MIDGIKSGGPPLRIAGAGQAGAKPNETASREKELAQAIDARLTSQLDRIRARLTGDFSQEPAADNPDGAGQRLDIMA